VGGGLRGIAKKSALQEARRSRARARPRARGFKELPRIGPMRPIGLMGFSDSIRAAARALAGRGYRWQNLPIQFALASKRLYPYRE
jgi:hypothetical protein